MTRLASAALTPLREARAMLLGGVRPVPAETVPLASATGLASAFDVLAAADFPAHRVAVRDGWAVEAALVGGASPYSPVVLPSAPSWIEAGERMPDTADALLPPEALAGLDVTEDIAAREGICEAGEDARGGERLIPAGTRLTPIGCAILASLGVTSVAVRRPRLRLVVTGTPYPAATDVLSPLLCAMIAGEGAIADAVQVPDDAESIAAALTDARADAIVVLGGTGFGRSDRSAAGLALAGDVRAHGVALTPGDSAAVGAVAGRPVLLLPGRPDAALAVFVALGRPLIAALAGSAPRAPEGRRLAAKISSTIGLSEVVFVCRRREAVLPLGSSGLPLRALVEADGVVLVDPDREGYPEGAQVEVLPL